MLKRYVNGLIISGLENKITTVIFKECLDASDVDSLGYSVDIDPIDRSITITYLKGISNGNFQKQCTGSYSIEPCIVNDKQEQLTETGSFFLLETVTVNGIEFIRKDASIQYIYQFLISEKHISKSVAMNVENYGFSIVIRDLDLVEHESIDENGKGITKPPMTIDEYCSLVNNSSEILAVPSNKSTFETEYIKNIPPTPFDGQDLVTRDSSVLKQVNEFALNESMCITQFIKKLREEWPSIDFYNDDEERNEEYSEHIRYRSHLAENRSTIFNSIVHEDDNFGRYLVSTIPIELEYNSQDVPLLIARKDKYKVGKFLNKLRKFKVPMKVKGLESPLLFQCSLFWDRDNMQNEYQNQQQLDQNQWSTFSYMYTCQLIVTLIEHKPWIGKPVINILSKIVDKSSGGFEVKGLPIDGTNRSDRAVRITDEWGNLLSAVNVLKNDTFVVQLRAYNGSEYVEISEYDSDFSANWKSENEDIASVSDGAILGKEEGEAVITVSYTYATVETTCSITVNVLNKIESDKKESEDKVVEESNEESASDNEL